VTKLALEGIGLRSGRPARVDFHARPGPFALVVHGVPSGLNDLLVVETERATTVRAGRVLVATVEHLFAACAALGLYEGLAVEVTGGEVPFLDGGSRTFADALRTLALSSSAPPRRVVKRETIEHGKSRYEFRPSSHGERSASVALDYDDVRLAPAASWAGDAKDFVERIAPARTFSFYREITDLVRRGQVAHVDPASVVVFAPDAVLASGAPVAADEPARHKLLDLLGDLFLYGGPPVGHVHAYRPGHASTHAILREARARGVVA
jgi:UDP-3-O-[3-hydroxymyristoyl] N-acetylglucosamine deacetylase